MIRSDAETEITTATLISHDKDRVIIGTTADERVSGLLILFYGVLVGFVFVGVPVYWALQSGRLSWWAYPPLFLFGLMSLAPLMAGLSILLQAERLVVDLRKRVYFGRRGVMLWGERFAGPLDDFDQIRLWEVLGKKKSRRRI